VMRPSTALKLSLRVPPTLDAEKGVAVLKRVLEQNPPYGAGVEFEVESASPGWNAPAIAPWLDRAVERASQAAYGAPTAMMGEGGSIPFMTMLGERYPMAQFMITGVLGPHSNAHGPNEFLHLPAAQKVTQAVALVLAEHATRKEQRLAA